MRRIIFIALPVLVYGLPWQLWAATPAGDRESFLFPFLLATALVLVTVVVIWSRNQIKQKTEQLTEKNRLLEDELIERQVVEAELRERQQQYQVLFEENQAVILLVDPESGEIVDANPAACRFYHYPLETLRGMNIREINRLSREEFQRRIERIQAGQFKQVELRHWLSTGELRHVAAQCSSIVFEGRSLICSIINDIGERKQIEKQLSERNDFLQSVIDGVADPLLVIDFNYQILQMNEAACEQLPAQLAEQQPLACHQVLHASSLPCDADDHPCPIIEIQETGQPVTVMHTLELDGELKIFELTASPLYNAAGELYAIIEVARDITERQQVQEQLQENERRLHHLAHHDPLTDLPNRLLFEDRLNHALSKARRSGRQLALFFLDLDRFKDVNDNLGHEFGDILLVDLAERLRKCIRESDTVARLGGDEFLMLLEDVESLEMVERMAERICQELTVDLNRDGYRQRVSTSVGISVYPDDGSNGQELLKAADQAMYEAKGKGKATYQFASTPQGQFNFET